jgi:hypothetical protein
VVQEVWTGAGRALRGYLQGITILGLAKDMEGRNKDFALSFEI